MNLKRNLPQCLSYICWLTICLARTLEDGAGSYETFEYNDLSLFSLRFEKCQFVKMYDDDLAQDEDNDSPLALKHFVVFRLCNDCETCEKYGKYTLEVADYLAYTVESQKRQLDEQCQNCNQQGCDQDDDGCQVCDDICAYYENMQDSGYVDASEYIECQQFAEEGDDDGNVYYVGPRCNSGNSIKVGVFSDENCWDPVDDVDIEELLGAKLSYHLLQHTYNENTNKSKQQTSCLSCLENNENDDDRQDLDDVNEMCENVYTSSAKCESETGLEYGFVQMNRDDQDYENQVENEFMACTFINSLIWNSYTETGEINIDAPQDVIVRGVTHKQTTFLGVLVCITVALCGLWYHFERKISQIERQPMLVPKGALA